MTENNLIPVPFQHVGQLIYCYSILCLILMLLFFCFFLILLVENIAKTGGKMVIISNSSRRSSVTIDKVKSLGFDASLFLGAITSGELTHQYLQRLLYTNIIFVA